ncbi:MAG: YjjG family noncanonical pyrimidine nucleotidase [Flavobacteriales bacterium]|nr:YjjG family noncanonical pyrimidine nucleotidase [Flavobacteriales bacterium]
MNRYQHIFFDLDGTLWDFQKNSEITLKEIYSKFLQGRTAENDFIQIYRNVNTKLWDDYKNGSINVKTLRNKRFHIALKKLDVEDEHLAKSISDYYLEECPKKKHLVNGAKEILEYLSSQNLKLHILTNGFSDLQHFKLKNCDLHHFFSNIFCSDTLKYSKPSNQAFQKALNEAKAKVDESLMIGDSIVDDIEGAKQIGMDQAFYSNSKKFKHATYQLKNLEEIRNIL